MAVPADPLEKKYTSVVPAIAKGIRGQQFTPTSSERYVASLKEHPDALKALHARGLSPAGVLAEYYATLIPFQFLTSPEIVNWMGFYAPTFDDLASWLADNQHSDDLDDLQHALEHAGVAPDL